MPATPPPGKAHAGATEQATLTVGRPGLPAPLAVFVRVLGGRGRPSEVRLASGKCVVGGGADANLVVDDPTVSRAHVEVSLAPEGVFVQDLGSRNGTFYLGQRVERMVLALGGRLRIGESTEIAIEPDLDTEAVPYDGDSYRGMVGRSAAMRRIFGILARLEGSLATVLVTGESGVGKELVARAVHEGSAVAGGPLVIVNCGALARELVASELFGHKRGAFTGATEGRRGAFASADGGTLFLDEVGELPLEVQPMLLRALESGEIRIVGGDRAERVRVRVVAATNRDLLEEVGAGRFREDLYYRLAVVRVHVPPLRERPEDVEMLAQLFGSMAGIKALPAHVTEQLKANVWRGNARELRNAIDTYGAIGVIPRHAGPDASSALDLALAQVATLDKPYADQKEEISDRFTRVYLRALLAQTGGNQTAAAKIAGLDRTYLGRLLAKHRLP
jgi:transcriptional regulator with GAF, ATPase, and Fis domain